MEWKEIKEENSFSLFNEVSVMYNGGLVEGALFIYDDRFDRYFEFMMGLKLDDFLYGRSYV